MASNGPVAVAPKNTVKIRRRQIWGAGGLVAQGVSELIGVPGLKDTAVFFKEGAKALKAPKWDDDQARKQINGVEELLSWIDTTLTSFPEPHLPNPLLISEGRLDGVESFRRDMETHKTEIEITLNERYTTKLTRQNEVALFLTKKNEQVSECISDFCVDGSIRANHAMLVLSKSNQEIQALSVLIREQSQRVADLTSQVRTDQPPFVLFKSHHEEE
ncbi:unnamed protein product [Rhizoctonia solani]|uniref:Uncharacterized protein n=1 Tax=Rhizoctonia solani TaxID=456999 RepID=A0A8H3AHW6_9AGAM|nr:unnamed protein product [Rhizoctonia solani]